MVRAGYGGRGFVQVIVVPSKARANAANQAGRALGGLSVESVKYMPPSDEVMTVYVAGRVANSTQNERPVCDSAGHNAAAISAAMSMEQIAIQLYAKRAEKAQDANEKALYDWLARWEMQHLKFLSEIDRELKEQIWNDSSFWLQLINLSVSCFFAFGVFVLIIMQLKLPELDMVKNRIKEKFSRR